MKRILIALLLIAGFARGQDVLLPPQGTTVGISDSLAKKLNKTQLATVNGQRLDTGLPITISAAGTVTSAVVTGALGYVPMNPAVTQTNPSWLVIDKTKVGLNLVDNTTDLTKPISAAQQSALDAKQNTLTPTDNPSYINSLPKSKVGLSLVDNTADISKPVSTAQQAALDLKMNLAGMTAYAQLNGSATYTGNNTFNGSNIFANLTTQTILPATGNTYNIGSSGTRIQTIYANYFMGGSAGAQFGTRTASAPISIAQGSSTTANIVDYIFGTTGNRVIQKSGVAPSDNGSLLSVNGQFQVNGLVVFNPDSLKTFADNAAAVAGGLQPGTLFKTVVGDKWTVEIAHSASSLPIYTSFIATGNTRTLWTGTAFQQQYQAQTSSESWSLNQASNRTAPTFRFEVRNGDTWSGDEPTTADPTGNDSRGQVKERSELYQKTSNTPYDTDIWVSYAFKLKGGAGYANFNYSDVNWFCDFGQWHATRSSGGPSWSFDMEDDQMYLRTRGQNGNTTVPLPSLPAVLRAQATVTRDVWHYFVVRVRHNKLSAGQIQWWLDGTQICNISGIPLGYDDATAGYWKFGIYRTWHEAVVAAEYANMEISQTSLSSGTYNRVATPLPLTP